MQGNRRSIRNVERRDRPIRRDTRQTITGISNQLAQALAFSPKDESDGLWPGHHFQKRLGGSFETDHREPRGFDFAQRIGQILHQSDRNQLERP